MRTLFALSIIFALVDFTLYHFIKQEKVRVVLHIIIAAILLTLGYVANFIGIKALSLPVVFSSYSVYCLGYIINKYNLMSYIKDWLSILIGVLILIPCYFGQGISLGDNSYWNPLYLLICSIAGWLLIYGISGLISKLPNTKKIEYLGKNTLPIVIHHFWCFKLVNLIQILVYSYSIQYLGAFPYLNPEHGWWIAFCVIGIIVPVLLQFIYDKGLYVINKCVKRK